MTRRPVHPAAAFTLLELVLVLAMLAMLVALAAPSLRGWGRGGRLRDAGDQLMAATRWARTQAVSTATVQRLEVAPEGNRFRVAPAGGAAEPAGPVGDFGREVALPQGVLASIERPDGDATSIDFHPNGRVTPGVIRVTAEWGEELAMQALTPADSFRNVATAAGGMR